TLDPLFIWGVFERALGLVFVVNFASALPQLRKLVGHHGIEPVEHLLSAIQRDLPFPTRLLRFPTLLWLSSHDVMLVATALLGLLSSLGVVIGAGAFTPFLFLFIFSSWISIQ